MYIKKLTITPVSYIRSQIIFNPSTNLTAEMIKNRLYVGNDYDTKVARALRKIPKHLKGWVNPECLVVSNKRFV